MNLQPRPRPFRSMTVHMGSRKIRTMIITMSLAVAVMFILVSILAAQLMTTRNADSFAARMLHSVSNQSLNSIMSREIPLYATADANQLGRPAEPRSNLLAMLFYLMTDIDIEHPVTLFNGQISAMAVSHFEPLTEDSKEQPGDEIPPADMGDAEPTPKQPPTIQTDGKPLVYIYHSHNRESYLPDLKGVTDFDKAYDKSVNITAVGDRLAQDLKQKQLETIHTKVDYWVPGQFARSYDFSRKTVLDVLAKHTSIQMVFDIHRDSLPRQQTTAKWNGQDVAKVSFIIGGSNPNSRKNEEFAKELQNKMQQLYPGVSKGAFSKKSSDYETKYNQDLHPHSILIEIGGPENTLEEANRTADLLANVIAEVAKNELYGKK